MQSGDCPTHLLATGGRLATQSRAGEGGAPAENLDGMLKAPADRPAPQSCPWRDCVYTSRPRRNHVGVSSYFCGWQPEHVSLRKMSCVVLCHLVVDMSLLPNPHQIFLIEFLVLVPD